MPNAKFFVDDRLLRERSAQVDAVLVQARALITATLGVTEEACHIVVVGVRGIPGQTPVNIELCLLEKPGRSRHMVEEFCRDLRNLAERVLEVPSAIRCTLVDPESYIVIRAG